MIYGNVTNVITFDIGIVTIIISSQKKENINFSINYDLLGKFEIQFEKISIESSLSKKRCINHLMKLLLRNFWLIIHQN